METFIAYEKTKNKIPIKICGVCKAGYSMNCIAFYSSNIKNHVFQDTKDIFLIDFKLAKFLTENTPIYVHALGASIFIESIELNTGGIIGDPHSISSRNESLEYLGNDLYCISYSGKFGAVFRSTKEEAQIIYDDFNKLLHLSNREIIPKVEKILFDTDLYILISDGSGKDSFFYVSHKY